MCVCTYIYIYICRNGAGDINNNPSRPGREVFKWIAAHCPTANAAWLNDLPCRPGSLICLRDSLVVLGTSHTRSWLRTRTRVLRSTSSVENNVANALRTCRAYMKRIRTGSRACSRCAERVRQTCGYRRLWEKHSSAEDGPLEN